MITHNRIFSPIGLLLVTVLLLPLAVQAMEQAGKTIQWFSGEVDQAFAQAATQQKPVFLYWGAKWCPPCNELKATLFQSPAFIEKTRFFIPVYLDGDTETAQHHGELFKVMGYPTLILFDKNGKEITRIPGGMDLERYPEVLDLVLRNIQPAAALVSKILEQGYTPSSAELRLLAHYAWQQDAGKVIGERDAVSVLRTLSDITPSHLKEIKGRFDAEYLFQLTEAKNPPTDMVKSDAVKRLTHLLTEPGLARDNFYFVVYDSRKVIATLTEKNSRERKRLTAAWTKSLDRLASNTTLSTADQLGLYKGRLELLALQELTTPEDLKTKIATDVNQARSKAKDVYERVTVSYTGYEVLQDSGQTRLARELLENELTQESNSSYWMLILASMAKKDEHNGEAINWYQRAWEKSQGAATRLQWGSYYVDNLCRLEPDGVERIETVSRQILVELNQQQKPLHGRNTRAVARTAASLATWAETTNNQPVFNRLKLTFEKICGKHFASENEKLTCSALFAKAKDPN